MCLHRMIADIHAPGGSRARQWQVYPTCDNSLEAERFSSRYFENKHVQERARDPSAVSGHYVDFSDGRTLSRAQPTTCAQLCVLC